MNEFEMLINIINRFENTVDYEINENKTYLEVFPICGGSEGIIFTFDENGNVKSVNM